MRPLPHRMTARRFSAGLVTVAYSMTQVVFGHSAEAGFWAQRAEMSRRLRNVSSSPSPLPSTTLPDLRRILPSDRPLAAANDWVSLVGRNGQVRDFHPRPGPLVIHLQDVHGHREAQENMAGLIQSILARHPDAPVVLEGAAGPVPLDAFRGDNPEANRGAAAFFFNAGILSGAEYAVLAAPRNPVVVGGEEGDLYKQNRRAVDEAKTLTGEWDNRLTAWRRALASAKKGAYSESMTLLDDRSIKWAEGEGFLERAAYLAETPVLPRPETGSALAQFTEVVALEKTLSLVQANRDRDEFFSRLSSRLSLTEGESLARQALAFRAGEKSASSFYQSLKSLAQSKGVPLGGFSAFDHYVRYVLLADSIRPEALNDELESREERLWEALMKTPRERDLRAADRDLALLSGLTRLALTPPEWKRYQLRRGEIHRLTERLAAYGVLGAMEGLAPFENFYEAAETRNAVFVDKTLAVLEGRPRGTPAILVAGGFHNAGLSPIFSSRGVGLLSVSPRLGSATENGGAFSLFSRDKTPLELLFDAPRLSLSETSALTVQGGARHQALASLSPTVRAVLEPGETRRVDVTSPDGGTRIVIAREHSEGKVEIPGARVVMQDVPTAIDSPENSPKVSVFSIPGSPWRGLANLARRFSRRVSKFVRTALFAVALIPLAGIPSAHAYTFFEGPAGQVQVELAKGETPWGAMKKVFEATGKAYTQAEIQRAATHNFAQANGLENPNLVFPGVKYDIPSGSLDEGTVQRLVGEREEGVSAPAVVSDLTATTAPSATVVDANSPPAPMPMLQAPVTSPVPSTVAEAPGIAGAAPLNVVAEPKSWFSAENAHKGLLAILVALVSCGGIFYLPRGVRAVLPRLRAWGQRVGRWRTPRVSPRKEKTADPASPAPSLSTEAPMIAQEPVPSPSRDSAVSTSPNSSGGRLSSPQPFPMEFTELQSLFERFTGRRATGGLAPLPSLSAFLGFGVGPLLGSLAQRTEGGWSGVLRELNHRRALTKSQVKTLGDLQNLDPGLDLGEILRKVTTLFVVLPYGMILRIFSSEDKEAPYRRTELSVRNGLNPVLKEDPALAPVAGELLRAFQARRGSEGFAIGRIHVVDGRIADEDTTRFVFLGRDREGHLIIHRDTLLLFSLLDNLRARRPDLNVPSTAVILGRLLDHENYSLAAYRRATKGGVPNSQARWAIHGEAESVFPVEAEFNRLAASGLTWEDFLPPAPPLGGFGMGDWTALERTDPSVLSGREVVGGRVLADLRQRVQDRVRARWLKPLGGALTLQVKTISAPEWTENPLAYSLGLLVKDPGQTDAYTFYVPETLSLLSTPVQEAVLESVAAQMALVAEGKSLADAKALADRALTPELRRTTEEAVTQLKNGIVTLSLAPTLFRHNVAIDVPEVVRVNAGPGLGLVDEEAFDPSTIGTSEYADQTGAFQTPEATKYRGGRLAASLGIMSERESVLRFAQALAEDVLARSKDQARVLVDGSAPEADVLARVLTANGIAVDWAPGTHTSGALSHALRQHPGRYAAALSGTVVLDGQGRVVPPEYGAEIWKDASTLATVRIHVDRRAARAQKLLTVIPPTLEENFVQSLPHRPVLTKLVIDLHKLSREQQEAHRALFEGFGAVAGVIDGTGTDALREEVLRRAKTGERVLGLQIHQNGQKMILVDTDGTFLSGTDVALLLAEAGLAGESVVLSPWDPPMAARFERAGLRVERQPPFRPSRRYSPPVLGGNVVAVALAMTNLSIPKGSSFRSTLTEVPTFRQRERVLTPARASDVTRALAGGSADAFGRHVAALAGRAYRSAEILFMNGSGRRALRVDLEEGQVWAWMEGDELNLKAASAFAAADDPKAGADADRLLAAVESWAEGQAASGRVGQALGGLLLYTAYLAALFGFAASTLAMPSLIWAITDNVPILFEYYLGPLAAYGFLFVAGLILAPNLFSVGEEALTTVLRWRISRRFARADTVRRDLHPFLAGDPKKRLADFPANGSNRFFAAWSPHQNDVFKGFAALPQAVQVMLYARDVRLSEYHINRDSRQRSSFSFFLMTLLSYAFLRPLALLKGWADIAFYVTRSLRERTAPDRASRTFYTVADVSRLDVLADGRVTAVHGGETAGERLMGKAAKVVRSAGAETAGEALVLIEVAGNRWEPLSTLVGDDLVHVVINKPEPGETPPSPTEIPREVPDAVLPDSYDPRIVGMLWGERVATSANLSDVSPALAESAWRKMRGLVPGATFQDPHFLTVANGFSKTHVRLRFAGRPDSPDGDPRAWGGFFRGPDAANGSPLYDVVLDPRVADLPLDRRAALLGLFIEGVKRHALSGSVDLPESDPTVWAPYFMALSEGRRWRALPQAWASIDPARGWVSAGDEESVIRAVQAFTRFLRERAGDKEVPIRLAVAPGREGLARRALQVLAANALREGHRLQLAAAPLSWAEFQATEANGALGVHVGEEGVGFLDREGRILFKGDAVDAFDRILAFETSEAELLDEAALDGVLSRGEGKEVSVSDMTPRGSVSPVRGEAASVARPAPPRAPLPLGIVWGSFLVTLGIVGILLGTGTVFLWWPEAILSLQSNPWVAFLLNMKTIYFLRLVSDVVLFFTNAFFLMVSSYTMTKVFHSRPKGAIFRLLTKPDTDPDIERLNPPQGLDFLPEYRGFHDLPMDRQHLSPWVNNLLAPGRDGRLQINQRALRIAYAYFRSHSVTVTALHRLTFGALSRETLSRWRLFLFVQMETQEEWLDRKLAPFRWGILSLFLRKNSRWFVILRQILFFPLQAVRLFGQSLGFVVHPTPSQFGELPEELTVPEPLASQGYRLHRAVVGTVNGKPFVTLQDGSEVRVTGWDMASMGKLRERMNAGDPLLVLTNEDPTQSSYAASVYLPVKGSAPETLWRRIDLSPRGPPPVASGGPPLYLRTGASDGGGGEFREVFLSAYGPWMRRFFSSLLLFGTPIVFAWITFWGLPEVFWSPAAWSAFLAAPGLATAGPVAQGVFFFASFIALWAAAHQLAQWVLGLQTPGRHPLWKRLAALTIAWAAVIPLRVYYAFGRGHGTQVLGDRSVERSAHFILEESNTIPGLGNASRHALLGMVDWVNFYRRAADLGPLSPDSAEALVDPLRNLPADPAVLLEKVQAAVAGLDAAWSDAAPGLGLPAVRGTFSAMAARHLTPEDARFMSSVDRLRSGLNDLFKEMDETLRSQIQEAVTHRIRSSDLLPAFEAALWEGMGKRLADSFEANALRQLRAVAKGVDLSTLGSAVTDLRSAQGPVDVAEKLRALGFARDQVLSRLQTTSALTHPLPETLAMENRPHALDSALKGIPGGPSDRSAYRPEAILAAARILEDETLQSLRDYRRMAVRQGIHPGAHFRNYESALLAESPLRLGGQFTQRALPLLERLAVGSQTSLEDVRRALTDLKKATPADGHRALSDLTKATEDLLIKSLTKRSELLASVPGHLRGGLSTSAVDFKKGDLTSTVREALTPDRTRLQGEGPDTLFNGYRALETGLQEALNMEGRRRIEDFAPLAEAIMEMSVHETAQSKNFLLSLGTGVVNSFVRLLGFQVDRRWLENMILNPNAETSPVVSRLAAVHYGLVIPTAYSLGADPKRLEAYNDLFKNTVAGAESADSLSSAMGNYFEGLDKLNAAIPGVKRVGGTHAAATFASELANGGRRLEALSPGKPEQPLNFLVNAAEQAIGRGRDPKSIETLAKGAGSAFKQMADQWKEAMSITQREALAHGQPRPAFASASTDLIRGGGLWGGAMDRQHAVFLNVLRRGTNNPLAGSGLDQALAELRGAKDEKEFSLRLPAFVEKADGVLKAEAAKAGVPYATGADRDLENLAHALKRAGLESAKAVGDRTNALPENVLKSLATGSWVGALVNLVFGMRAIEAEKDLQATRMAALTGEVMDKIYDKMEAVAASFPARLADNLAQGGRAEIYLPGDPLTGLGAGLSRMTEDLAQIFSALKWHAVRNAEQRNTSVGEQAEISRWFDNASHSLKDLGRSEAARGPAADLTAAEGRLFNYATAVEPLWNRALELSRPGTREKPPLLQLTPLLRSVFARDTAQPAPTMSDVKSAVARLSQAAAHSAQQAFRSDPDGAAAVRALRDVPDSFFFETSSTRAAFERDASALAQEADTLFAIARPDRLGATKDFWRGSAALSFVDREKLFWEYVEATDRRLAALKPGYAPGQLRTALEAGLRRTGTRAGAQDPAALVERGLRPLVATVAAELKTVPDANWLRETAFPALAKGIVQGAFVETTGEAAQAVESGMNRVLAELAALRGVAAPALALDRLKASTSDGDFTAELRRAVLDYDRSLAALAPRGYVPGTVTRTYDLAAAQAPLGPRAQMGAALAALRDSFHVLDQNLGLERQRAADFLAAFGRFPTQENAQGALRIFELESRRLSQAAPAARAVDVGGAVRRAFGAQFARGWPDDPQAQSDGLAAVVRAGAEAHARAIRAAESDRAFPAGAVVNAFLQASEPGNRTEGQPLRASHVQAGLAAALGETRRSSDEVIAHLSTRRDVFLAGGAPHLSPDHLFSGPSGERVLEALKADVEFQNRALSRDARLVDFDLGKWRVPDVGTLRGASLEGVKAWVRNYARSVDNDFSGQNLRYPAGGIALKVENALAQASTPEEALRGGLSALDGAARSSLLEVHAWNGRRLAFGDLAKEWTQSLARVSNDFELRNAVQRGLQGFLKTAALFQASPPANPDAWAASGVKDILAQAGSRAPEVWVGEIGLALDGYMQKHPLGGAVPQGALIEAVARGQREGSAGFAAPLDVARNAQAQLFFRAQEVLEDAYTARVDAFAAESMVVTDLPEGYSLRQAPGLAVRNVAVEGDRVVVYLSDARGATGTRVDLAGLPGASASLLSRIQSVLPTGTPVLLALADGQTGRQVTGTLFIPSEGSRGPAPTGTPGAYANVNARLGAGSILPFELKSAASLETPGKFALHLHAQGLRLAELAFILSRGDETLKKDLIAIADRHFLEASGTSISWWTRLLQLDAALPLREALSQGRMGEQAAHYFGEAAARLQSAVGKAGGAHLAIDVFRGRLALGMKAGTLHGTADNRLASWAVVQQQGVKLVSEQLLSSSRAEGDLERAFADSVRGATRLEDLARSHQQLTNNIFDAVRLLAARHGQTLTSDFEALREDALVLGQSLERRSANEVLSDYHVRLAEAVAMVGGRLGPMPAGTLSSVSDAVGAYSALAAEMGRALRERDGEWTRETLLSGRPGDPIAQLLASAENLPPEQAAALAGLSLLPSAVARPRFVERAFSFGRAFWEKVVVFSFERTVVRYVFGLFVVGPALVFWAPAFAYKVAAWRALNAPEGSDAALLPEGVAVSETPFLGGVRHALLAMVEHFPDLGGGKVRRMVVHPAFRSLSGPARAALLEYAEAEDRLGSVRFIGGALVHFLRLLELNQVAMGVGILAAGIKDRWSGEGPQAGGPGASWFRFPSMARASRTGLVGLAVGVAALTPGFAFGKAEEPSRLSTHSVPWVSGAVGTGLVTAGLAAWYFARRRRGTEPTRPSAGQAQRPENRETNQPGPDFASPFSRLEREPSLLSANLYDTAKRLALSITSSMSKDLRGLLVAMTATLLGRTARGETTDMEKRFEEFPSETREELNQALFTLKSAEGHPGEAMARRNLLQGEALAQLALLTEWLVNGDEGLDDRGDGPLRRAVYLARLSGRKSAEIDQLIILLSESLNVNPSSVELTEPMSQASSHWRNLIQTFGSLSLTEMKRVLPAVLDGRYRPKIAPEGLVAGLAVMAVAGTLALVGYGSTLPEGTVWAGTGSMALSGFVVNTETVRNWWNHRFFPMTRRTAVTGQTWAKRAGSSFLDTLAKDKVMHLIKALVLLPVGVLVGIGGLIQVQQTVQALIPGLSVHPLLIAFFIGAALLYVLRDLWFDFLMEYKARKERAQENNSAFPIDAISRPLPEGAVDVTKEIMEHPRETLDRLVELIKELERSKFKDASAERSLARLMVRVGAEIPMDGRLTDSFDLKRVRGIVVQAESVRAREIKNLSKGPSRERVPRIVREAVHLALAHQVALAKQAAAQTTLEPGVELKQAAYLTGLSGWDSKYAWGFFESLSGLFGVESSKLAGDWQAGVSDLKGKIMPDASAVSSPEAKNSVTAIRVTELLSATSKGNEFQVLAAELKERAQHFIPGAADGDILIVTGRDLNEKQVKSLLKANLLASNALIAYLKACQVVVIEKNQFSPEEVMTRLPVDKSGWQLNLFTADPASILFDPMRKDPPYRVLLLELTEGMVRAVNLQNLARAVRVIASNA